MHAPYRTRRCRASPREACTAILALPLAFAHPVFADAGHALDPDVDPGAALYLGGEGSGAAEALLAGGTVRVPADRFPCINCHGGDGLGGGEGGTVVPAIVWSRLGTAGAGRGAYDRDRFARAVRDGVAANGRTLAATMPRYRVDDAALDALLDYLRRLDGEQRRGVDAASVRLLAPADAERRAGAAAAVAEFNRRGGAFGRLARLVEGGDHLIAFDEIAKTLDARTRRHVLDRLREIAAADGYPNLQPLSERSPRRDLVSTGPEPDRETLLLDVEPDARELRELIGHTLYAWVRDAGPHLRTLLERDNRLVLLDADAEASRWALQTGLGGAAAAGRTDGSLLLTALLGVGRDVTRARVLRLLERVEPDADERVLRSGAIGIGAPRHRKKP